LEQQEGETVFELEIQGNEKSWDIDDKETKPVDDVAGPLNSARR
jgi:hypothetical protein